MTKYCLYHDKINKKYLVYDSFTQMVSWEDFCTNIEPESNVINSFLMRIDEVIGNSLPKDVEIHKVRSNNFLRIIDQNDKKFLIIGKKEIGEISSEKDIEQVKLNGGVIISYIFNSGKKVISILTNKSGIQSGNKMVNKKIQVNQGLFSEYPTENQVESYYEGIIKIPKVLFQSDELSKRLIDADVQIYRKISEVNSKIDRIIEYTERTRFVEQLSITQKNQEERKINELQKTLEDLYNQNQSLLSERQYLQKQIEDSRTYALNKLKSLLKFSAVAVSRHVDLNQEGISTQDILKKLLQEIVNNSSVPLTENQINDLVNDEKTSSILREFSDSIDAKIQSLKEIKKEFLTLNILETGGEK